MNSINEPTDNPFYVQYEAVLIELHRLIAAGKGNEDEADVVRDKMDGSEQQLIQKEIMRLNGLSADLYMLQDDETYEPYQGTQQELIAALGGALRRLDYEAILSLLRKGTPFLKPAQVAALRGRCYAMLEHLETALLFMRYAAEKEPEQVAHRLYILGLLTHQYSTAHRKRFLKSRRMRGASWNRCYSPPDPIPYRAFSIGHPRTSMV